MQEYATVQLPVLLKYQLIVSQIKFIICYCNINCFSDKVLLCSEDIIWSVFYLHDIKCITFAFNVIWKYTQWMNKSIYWNWNKRNVKICSQLDRNDKLSFDCAPKNWFWWTLYGSFLFTINRHITQYSRWVVSFDNTSLIVLLFFKMNKCPIISLASMKAGLSIKLCAYPRTTDDCFCVTDNSGSNWCL